MLYMVGEAELSFAPKGASLKLTLRMELRPTPLVAKSVVALIAKIVRTMHLDSEQQQRVNDWIRNSRN